MLGSTDSASPLAYLLPIGVAVAIILVRNARPRRLKIERLWLTPAIYVALIALALSASPPPLTPTSVGLLIAAAALGAAIGWQRGRLTEVHIHPETHDLTSRQSPIGLVFIFAIFALRYAARYLLVTDASVVGVPMTAALDAFFVLAVAMLSVQRIEIWRRASKMLEEARAAGPGAPPPESLVS